MVNKEKFLRKLYEILATLRYNSERTEVIEEILKNFLISPDIDLDIKKEATIIFNKKKKGFESKNNKNFDIEIKKELFKQKCILLSNTPHEFIPEYIYEKFSPFNKYFEKQYHFDMNSLWIFAFKLMEYLEFKKYSLNFWDEMYKFKSKEEYADMSFISIPSEEYIKNWKNIITFSVSEIKKIIPLCKHDIDRVIDTICININTLKDKKEFDLHLKPLLRIDDILILLAPHYITRSLPSLYELLFKKITEYNENKGKSFEKLAQKTIKQLPFKLLAYNVEYRNGETDAVLKFINSAWFVEITSHPPSEKALRGDWNAISSDLTKTIKKCIKQGERCLNNIDKEPLKTFSKNVKIKGTIVVLDGVYPQLNVNTAFTFHKEKFPIYIINWFDLRLLISQPEINLFEEFLLWRTTNKPMPVICFDEKDYWAFYFDNYRKNKRMRKAFKTMQRKQIRNFYISYRFNNKEYLKNLV